MSDINTEILNGISRRSWLKMAGIGAGAAGIGLLSGCSQATADTETAAAAAPDPNALAIMSSNENPFGPSPMAIEAMRAEVGNIYRYSGPLLQEFGEMIAEREGVSPDQVLITNGSTPLLAAYSQWVEAHGALQPCKYAANLAVARGPIKICNDSRLRPSAGPPSA